MLDQPTFFIRDVAITWACSRPCRTVARTSSIEATQRSSRCCKPLASWSRAMWTVSTGPNCRSRWAKAPDGLLLFLMPVTRPGRPPTTTPDGLKEALEDFFVAQRRSATYSFGVQPYVDEKTTPIEDGTSVWGTPFEGIATLTIPAQDFTSPDQYAFCENLSYTPWHCVPEHQPLGGIQRCRKRVYGGKPEATP